MMTCTCPTCGQPIPDDGVFIDRQKSVVIRNGVTSAKLGHIEYRLVLVLWENRPKVMTYDRLISELWGRAEPSDARRSLSVTLHNARRKMEPLGIDLRTLHGVGLFFVADGTKVRITGGGKPMRPRLLAA